MENNILNGLTGETVIAELELAGRDAERIAGYPAGATFTVVQVDTKSKLRAVVAGVTEQASIFTLSPSDVAKLASAAGRITPLLKAR